MLLPSLQSRLKALRNLLDTKYSIMEQDSNDIIGIIICSLYRYWLYGDCDDWSPSRSALHSPADKPAADKSSTDKAATDKPDNKRRRGWFPRHCVVPLLEHTYRNRSLYHLFTF